MFAFALAVLFPFIWMLFCSFKPLNEIYEFPPRFLSGNMSLKNYRQVLFEQNPSFLTYLKNTAVTTDVYKRQVYGIITGNEEENPDSVNKKIAKRLKKYGVKAYYSEGEQTAWDFIADGTSVKAVKVMDK